MPFTVLLFICVLTSISKLNMKIELGVGRAERGGACREGWGVQREVRRAEMRSEAIYAKVHGGRFFLFVLLVLKNTKIMYLICFHVKIC